MYIDFFHRLNKFQFSKYMKLCVFAIFFCTFFSCNAQKLKTTTLQIVNSQNKKVNVVVEIAKTQVQQAQGFMNRKKIPDGTGMIFVYDVDQVLSFWMKNTPVALDIAYIDKDGIIRDIFDMTPFSQMTVKSTRSVRYALEVPKGWFDKNSIKVGDKVVDLSF